MTSLPAPSQDLPDGWAFSTGRPHSLVEAEKRLSPTALHVLVGRNRAEVIKKIRAVEARAEQP